MERDLDPEDWLLAQAARLVPRYMDISHDMGWAEAFVLDGDSLLLHSLLGAPGTRVDVGQPLAAVYRAECRLKMLLDRGCRFVVLFSPALAAAWAADDPAAAALRAVFTRHMSALAWRRDGLRVAECDPGSPEWQRLLDDLKPRYVMVADMVDEESSRQLAGRDGDEGGGTGAAAARRPLARVRRGLLAAAYLYLLARRDLVFLGGLQANSHSVFGYLLRASYAHRLLAEEGPAVSAVAAALLPGLIGSHGVSRRGGVGGSAASVGGCDNAGRGAVAFKGEVRCGGSQNVSCGGGEGQDAREGALVRALLSQSASPREALGGACAVRAAAAGSAAASSLDGVGAEDYGQEAPTAAGVVAEAAAARAAWPWLSRVWALHCVLLDWLSLESRALPVATALRSDPGAARMTRQLLMPFARAALASAPEWVAPAFSTAEGAPPPDRPHPPQLREADAPEEDGQLRALAELADPWDTGLFFAVAISLLNGGTSAASALLAALPPDGAGRRAAAVLAAVDALVAGADVAQLLSAVREPPKLTAAALVPPPEVAEAWGTAAAAAARAAAAEGARHEALQRRLGEEICARQQAALAMGGSCDLVSELRAALERGDAASSISLLPDPSACAAAKGHGETANGDSVERSGAAPPLAAGRFAAAQRPWQERYHWHIRTDLKPFFMLEAKADLDMEAQRKQLLRMKPHQLASRKFSRFMTRDEAGALSGLLEAVRAEDDTKARDELLRRALRIADKAMSHWATRQKQFSARAMNRMVLSLQGGFYDSGGGSKRGAAITAAAQLAEEETEAGGVAKRGGGGGGGRTGKGGKSSADQIRRDNAARLAALDAERDLGSWRLTALRQVDSALDAPTETALARAAEAVDGFAAAATTPAGAAHAAAARLVVAHAWLRRAAKGAAKGGGGSNGGGAVVAACSGSAGGVPSRLEAPLRLLLLAIQRTLALPPRQQAEPVDLPKGTDGGGGPAAPLAVAAAAARAAGFGDLASCLMQTLPPRAAEQAAATAAAASDGRGGGMKKVKGKEGALKESKADKSKKKEKGPSKGEGQEAAGAPQRSLQPKLKAIDWDAAGWRPPSAERLQLLLVPHLLPRERGGERDGRVAFVPDTWQRRLLDTVDAGSSALVCAPTSSGKTFIASYLTERVLRAGPEGRVVIVLPTKALVNQVAAQVYKDFGADDPNVYGIFTRDFRINEMGCRVLVTVPQCLEILVLSPANRDWIESIQAAIFDEVHCISENDGGDVWERLLLCLRCPILALSATVGNPQEFAAWLQRVKALQWRQDGAPCAVAPASAGAPHERRGSVGRKHPRAAPPQALSSDQVADTGRGARDLGDEVMPPSYRVDLILHEERYNDLLHSTFLPHPQITPAARSAAAAVAGDVDDEDEDADEGGGVELLAGGGGGRGGEPAAAAAGPGAAAGQPGADQERPLQPVWTVGTGGGGGGGFEGRHGRLLRLHPAGSVSAEHLARAGWPKGLALSPDEALALFDDMDAELAAAAADEEADPGALQREQQERQQRHQPATAAEGDGGAAAGAVGDRAVLGLAATAAWLKEARAALDGCAVEGIVAAPSGATPGDPPRRGHGQEQQASPAALITRQAAKRWAGRLVELLVSWARQGQQEQRQQQGHGGPLGPEVVSRVLRRLGRGAEEATAQHAAEWEVANPRLPLNASSYQLLNLMPLLRELRERALMPAIVFQFQRSMCEAFVSSTVALLEEEEAHARRRHAGLSIDWRGGQYARELANKRRDAERAREAAEALARARESEAHAKRRGGDSDEEGQGAAEGAGPPGGAAAATFVVDGIVFAAEELDDAGREVPDPSFTFHAPDKAASEVLLRTVEDLRSQGCEEDLLRGLMRGVAAHHGGLDTKYRQAVEMLFRSKHLAVVAATGTLAYGIHMPCRAVVMAGDSPFLDALNYAQMSGRSGRRGLDPVGHVVHYALPLDRVHALRVSELPRLRGQFLLTPTLVLRMLLLHRQLSDDLAARAGGGAGGTGGQLQAAPAARQLGPAARAAEASLLAARRSLLALVEEPFLGASDPGVAGRQRVAFEFALDYLKTSNLLNTSGAPVGFAGLATHIFWTEPSNFLVGRLLASGAFHDLAAANESAAGRQEAFLLVLCHAFLRQRLHPMAVAHWRRHKADTPSLVILPSLPAPARAAVEQHEAGALQLLTRALAARLRAARAAASAAAAAAPQPGAQRQQHELPVSGLRYKAAAGAPWVVQEATSGCSQLGAWRVPSSVCSPFAGLSGGGDAFGSAAELLEHVPQGAAPEAAALPLLGAAAGGGGELNAYILDYYKHVSKRALVRANGMLEGDAWQSLKSLEGILHACVHCLEACQADDSDGSGGDYDDDDDDNGAVKRGPKPSGGGVASTPEHASLDAQVVATFKGLAAEFREKFSRFNAPSGGRRT